MIGTWNTRTLWQTGKLEELTHEMSRYHWNLLGLCETRWTDIGETTTLEGHKIYYSGKQDKHEEGVGFLVHNNIVNSILGCRPVSSRLISIRLKASPFNITVIQAYAPTTDYSDEEIEDFYQQLQEVVDQTPKKDIIVVQGDWNAKIGKDAYPNWKGTCGSSCNQSTNDRGLRLLEFAAVNSLTVANTLGKHKISRKMTCYSPDNKYHNQIDYIMVPKRFRAGVNIAHTRTFPGADIGSDHDLVMMTFRVRLKTINKPKFTRLWFNLDKLKDPAVKEESPAMIGGKFAPLTVLGEKSINLKETVETFNTAIIETAKEILGKQKNHG